MRDVQQDKKLLSEVDPDFNIKYPRANFARNLPPLQDFQVKYYKTKYLEVLGLDYRRRGKYGHALKCYECLLQWNGWN